MYISKISSYYLGYVSIYFLLLLVYIKGRTHVSIGVKKRVENSSLFYHGIRSKFDPSVLIVFKRSYMEFQDFLHL